MGSPAGLLPFCSTRTGAVSTTSGTMKPTWTRRRFLERTLIGAGWLLASAQARLPAALASEAARSRLRVAVIGCGGRGEASLEAALDENLVAIADVQDSRLAAAAAKAAQRGLNPKSFTDYRRLFDSMPRDLDAVFVATPDHHHAPASLRAIELGMHVFCEKPLCHDLTEARVLAAAAKRRGVITQMGNQGHCAEGYRRVCEYIWAGAIGDIVETHSWNGFVNGGSGGRPPVKPLPAGLHWDEWIGPAAVREYHEGLHPLYWRYWWDFGTGALGDWGCHNMDGVLWATKGAHPARIELLRAVGGSEEKYPEASIIRWDFPAIGAQPAFKAHWYDGAAPNTDPARKDASGQMLRTIPNQPPLVLELRKRYDFEIDQTFASGGTFYVGTKGILYSGNYGNRPRLIPDDAHQAFGTPPVQIPRVRGTHFAHFIQCCKERTPTCADFPYAARMTEFLLLGHLAIKAGVGRAVEWDADHARCANLPELDRWIRRPHRQGWEVT
jgi:predicted dehydrogenase